MKIKKIIFVWHQCKGVMKIVVASDSFKGSLTSLQVADAIEQGLLAAYPDCEVVKLDIADGGEGTARALQRSLEGRTEDVRLSDPLGRSIEASYVISKDGLTAVVELSSASGLTLVSPQERNPMNTSTYGTGQMISDALAKGCRRIIVGLGGSATNDGGMGMLSALGFRFVDVEGNVLEGKGENLSKVYGVEDEDVLPEAREVEFIIAADVDSPFCGPDGAAYVFAAQKGADCRMIENLDRGMACFAAVVSGHTGKDIVNLPGSGAAGGAAGGLVAFLNAEIRRGIELVLDEADFDRIAADADMVITGEGRIDFQTMKGKTPYGVMKRAVRLGIPVIAIGGSVAADLQSSGFDALISVTPPEMPLHEAMEPRNAVENIIKVISSLNIRLSDN